MTTRNTSNQTGQSNGKFKCDYCSHLSGEQYAYDKKLICRKCIMKVWEEEL